MPLRARSRARTRRTGPPLAVFSLTPVTELVDSALLIAGVLALAAGAWRIASLAAAAGGIELALATVVIAAAAAIIECLALGLVGLGSNPPTLAAAAILSWAAAGRWLPAPAAGGLLRTILDFLAGAPPGVRALLGAGTGVLVALSAFDIQHPLVGVDGMIYHLPEIASWVHSGHPGAIVTSLPGVPTGSYPLTNEVLLAWGVGLMRSFAPVALWSATGLAMLLGGGWLGLRRLGVPRGVAVLALAAVVLAPDFAAQLNTPMNDGITLGWLVVTAALTLAAVPDRPRLFAVAVLAGALSIGTKTTGGPLVVLVLLLGAVRMRGWSRPALVLAGLAGLAAGGTWYVRDLIQHGSPFWPLVRGPFGDPMPPKLVAGDVRFIAHPLATLDGRVREYGHLLAGSLVLLTGGIGAVALERGRRVAAASAVTALSLLLWANAPFTGRSPDPSSDASLVVTRYLLPGVACGALALALAARRRHLGGRLATVLLAAGFLWSLHQSAQLPFPALPGVKWLLGGALLGAVLAAAARRPAGVLRRRPLRLAGVAVGALALLAAGALAAASPGYVMRNTVPVTGWAAPLLQWFAGVPAFRDGSDPITTTPPAVGLLAGDELRHGVRVIGQRESCARIEAGERHGWVVVYDFPPQKWFPVNPANACLAGQHPVFASGVFRVYRSG